MSSSQFFLGNNPVSRIGVGLTTASALTLIGFWVVDVVGHGGSVNPYVEIILDLCLPSLFVLGLMADSDRILIRRRSLRAAGQLPTEYPKVDLANPIFRSGLHFVIVATFINFVIVGTASYRGVSYMDKPSFCSQSCDGARVYLLSCVAASECGLYRLPYCFGTAGLAEQNKAARACGAR